MSHLDSSDCSRTSTTPAASPGRRAGALTAATSIALLSAAGAALAAPSSSTESTVALDVASTATTAVVADELALLSAREAVLASSTSRSSSREEARGKTTKQKKPEVVGVRYVTAKAGVNVRRSPDRDARSVTALDYREKVRITDRTTDGWRQVVMDGKTRWVKGSLLAEKKPKALPAKTTRATSTSSSRGGVSTGKCTNGSTVSGGANVSAVHRAVCARFPSITSYGGYRPGGGNHSSGRAVDIMVSGSLGWEVAKYVRANAGRLGVTEVIYSQRIWTTQRAGEGWRSMSDRGSATANHYDHVHVSTR